MAETFVYDDIVAEVQGEHYDRLIEMWARIDTLTNGTIHDYSDASLSDLLAKNDLPVDMKFVQNKHIKAALQKTDPAAVLAALRKNVKHEDPDTLIVRFLRARSWNLDNSTLMLLKSLSWRAQERIEEGLLAGGDAKLANPDAIQDPKERKIAQEMLAMIACGQSFVHGADKNGRPLVYIRVKLHDPYIQGAEAFLRGSIMEVENTRMLLRPPITCVSLVFDLTGFGMKNMDMNALKVMASGLQDNYPECLGQVYVYAAPWIVGQIWKAIKLWLDPVVAAKVQFISNVEQLSKFIDIESIPTYMGGKYPYEWKWIQPEQPAPLTADDISRRDSFMAERSALLDEYITTTRKWALAHLAKDTATSEAAQNARHALVLKLTDNYWKVDPFVRGRVLLDREGILRPDGSVKLE